MKASIYRIAKIANTLARCFRKIVRRRRPNSRTAPWHAAMLGAAKLTTPEREYLVARLSHAVARLTECRGTADSWRKVFDVINLIEAFGATTSLVRDAKEFVKQQQDSVEAAMDRHRSTGSNVLFPAEVTMLQDLCAAWESIVDVCSCSELFKAEERVVRKVGSALSSGDKRVRIIEAIPV